MSVYLGKRPPMGPPEEQPPLKILKTEQIELKEWPLLPYDLILKILGIVHSFGSSYGIMDQLSKDCARFMEHHWEILCKRWQFNFKWSEAETHPYPNQFCYLQAMLLNNYILRSVPFFVLNSGSSLLAQSGFPNGTGVQIRPPPKNQPDYQNTRDHCHKKYGGSFPSVTSYIYTHLTYLIHLQHPQLSSSNEDSSFKLTGHAFEKRFSKPLAGDKLLIGLFYLTQSLKHMLIYESSENRYVLKGPLSRLNNPFKIKKEKTSLVLAFDYLKQAIAEGATCATNFAIQILAPLQDLVPTDDTLYPTFFCPLAIESAKQGDHRGLALLMNDARTKELYEKGVNYPPILIHRARLTPDLKEKEALLEQALQEHRPHIDWQIWTSLAVIKKKLEKKEEAQLFIDQLMDYYGNQMFDEQICNQFDLVIRKLKTGWPENSTLEQTILQERRLSEISPGWRDTDPAVLSIDNLSDLILDIQKTKVSTEIWIRAIQLKIYLQKWDQALSYLVEFMQTLDDTPSSKQSWMKAGHFLILLMRCLKDDKDFASYINRIPLEKWYKIINHSKDVLEVIQLLGSCLNSLYNINKTIKHFFPLRTVCLLKTLILRYGNNGNDLLPMASCVAAMENSNYDEKKDMKGKDYLTLLCQNIQITEDCTQEFLSRDKIPGPKVKASIDNLYSYTLSASLTWLKESQARPDALPKLFWSVYSKQTSRFLDLTAPILIQKMEGVDPHMQAQMLGVLCEYHLSTEDEKTKEKSLSDDQLIESWLNDDYDLNAWINTAIAFYNGNPPSWIGATAVKVKRRLGPQQQREAEEILRQHPEITKELNFTQHFYQNKN